MKNIKIFATQGINQNCCHLKNDLIFPICAGAALGGKIQDGILTDNIDDNISEKNKLYCELTTQYWAWKNVDADYYGFFHYRRYLSFSDKKMSEDKYGNIVFNYLNENAQEKLFLNENAMRKKIEEYDLLIPAPFITTRDKHKSIYNQYKSIPHLFIKDLDCILEIISEKYPEFADDAKEYIFQDVFYPCNMFIASKKIFHEYSEWLFDILFEFEKRTDMTNYSKQGLRTIGHLGERLFGIYYTHIKKLCKYKTGILQRAIFWNTDWEPLPHPAFKRDIIPVVFSCSDFYVPYAAITLQSLINHSSEKYNYDITFLNTDISKASQAKLKSMVQDKSNFNIQFYNIGSIISRYHFIANNHVSVETFYRLFVQQIFQAYSKIVYLDSDLILKSDISELYNIDIGDYLLAATKDADFIGEYCGAIPKVKKYCDEVLQLKNPYTYFQAGVIVFNIKAMNKMFNKTELAEYATKREYMYVDQDVLNVKCSGQIYYLDMAWNVMTDCAGQRYHGIIEKGPYYIYEMYVNARKHPKIIHYAGFSKPWNHPDEDFALDFWNVARGTIWYELILSRMSSDLAWHSAHNYIQYTKQNTSIKKLLKDFLYKYFTKFFPKGSSRRSKAKKMYFKLRGWE